MVDPLIHFPPDYVPRHRRLIAVDSDGTALNTMPLKYTQCYVPLFIKSFALEPLAEAVREVGDFVLLHSVHRGLDRFRALVLMVDLLAGHPAATGVGEIPRLAALRAMLADGRAVNVDTLAAEAERTSGAAAQELGLVAQFSAAFDACARAGAATVTPFLHVRETLEAAVCGADLVVVSSAPAELLREEWRRHGLDSLIRVFLGQQAGSKVELLGRLLGCGYAAEEVMVIGDSPGDAAAAAARRVFFFPILPGREAECWRYLRETGLRAFFAGTYGGACAAERRAEFVAALAVVPPWER